MILCLLTGNFYFFPPNTMSSTTPEPTVEEYQTAEEYISEGHGLAYLGWIGRTMARAPKLIAAQRWMAYASEGTEPFRPVASKWFVRSGYALSFLYVLSDIGVRTRLTWLETHSKQKATVVFGDTLVFHSLASLVIPAVFIHQIVHGSSKLVSKMSSITRYPRVAGLAPTIIGLCSIPFVVGPIDHGVEFAMDKTLRQYYEVHSSHEHHD